MEENPDSSRSLSCRSEIHLSKLPCGWDIIECVPKALTNQTIMKRKLLTTRTKVLSILTREELLSIPRTCRIHQRGRIGKEELVTTWR